MNRRSFLSSCLALSAAPAIVRADSLMRIVPRDVEVLTAASHRWVRFTYEHESGEAKFYESADGELWSQTGNGLITRGAMAQYYSESFAAPVSAYPKTIGDTDIRICVSTDENTSQIDLIPSIVAKLR